MFALITSNIVTLIVFVLILSVLVMVHELGHFLAALFFHIKVEEFGFGLPPRLFGIKRGEIMYSLNWLPIGGFVRLLGENAEVEVNPKKVSKEIKERAFYMRPIWQRSIVLVAGVCMNFVLAVVIISFLFTQGVNVPTNRVHVEKIIANSPAESIGLLKNDVITSLQRGEEKISVAKGEDLTGFTRKHLGELITLHVNRDGKEYTFQIIPRKTFPSTEGPMGLVISTYEKKSYSVWEAPIKGLGEALRTSYEIAKGIGTLFWKLVTFQNLSKDVAGPIGIEQMTGEAIKFGLTAVLEMMGILSLNLAIVNILPFPALDGGRLLFVIIEAVSGRRVKAQVEHLIHNVGMIILLGLVLVVTINDIIRLFVK